MKRKINSELAKTLKQKTDGPLLRISYNLCIGISVQPSVLKGWFCLPRGVTWGEISSLPKQRLGSGRQWRALCLGRLTLRCRWS